MPLRICLVLASVVAAARLGCAPAVCEPTVAGRVETAWIGDPPFALPARLDAASTQSVLGAGDIVLFDRAGVEWVRFVLGVKGGREHGLERPVLRMAVEGEPPDPVAERPVVRLRLCLAGKQAPTDFILVDRTGRELPLRIGRDFLKDSIRVDETLAFVASKACGAP